MSEGSHTITKAIVHRGFGRGLYRAECSCGDFRADARRLSVPQRRRQDRLIAEHLASDIAAGPLVAMLTASAIEAPL